MNPMEVLVTTRNGVTVRMTRFRDSSGAFLGSTVEADCMCFGMPFRTHSREICPARTVESKGD